jgi:hypothetical protein
MLGYERGGIIATVALAISPTFFLGARVCLEDIPSLSLAASAVFIAYVYTRSGRLGWVLLSGAVYSLALLMKLLPIIVLPALIIIVFERGFSHRITVFKALMHVAVFLTTVGMLLIIPFVLLGPLAMFEQTVLFPSQASTAYAHTRTTNWLRISLFLIKGNFGLTLMATVGILVIFVNCRREEISILIWFMFTILALLLHVPLWPHLLVSLLFPITILAAKGVSRSIRMLKESKPLSTQWLLGFLLLAAFLTTWPWSLVGDVNVLTAPNPDSAVYAIDWLRRSTSEDAIVLTDEALIPFAAGRRVPPPLVDTSSKRIKSGLLTSDEVIAVSETHRPSAVVLWNKGRFEDLPEVIEWIRKNYRSRITLEDGTQLFSKPYWGDNNQD